MWYVCCAHGVDKIKHQKIFIHVQLHHLHLNKKSFRNRGTHCPVGCRMDQHQGQHFSKICPESGRELANTQCAWFPNLWQNRPGPWILRTTNAWIFLGESKSRSYELKLQTWLLSHFCNDKYIYIYIFFVKSKNSWVGYSTTLNLLTFFAWLQDFNFHSKILIDGLMEAWRPVSLHGVYLIRMQGQMGMVLLVWICIFVQLKLTLKLAVSIRRVVVAIPEIAQNIFEVKCWVKVIIDIGNSPMQNCNFTCCRRQLLPR